MKNKQQELVRSDKDGYCEKKPFAKALLVLTILQTVVCTFSYIVTSADSWMVFALVILMAAGLVVSRTLWNPAPIVRRVVRIAYLVLCALPVLFFVISLLVDVSGATELTDSFTGWSAYLYGCMTASLMNILLVFLLPVMAATAAHGLTRDQWILRLAALCNLPLTALSLLHTAEAVGFPTFNDGLLPLGDFWPLGLGLSVLAGIIALLTLMQYMVQNKAQPLKNDVS